jgi:DNA topoisomerase-1
MKKGIIVESPTKAKTISKFLSNDYTIKSSFGHIRDLPKKKLGIDIKDDYRLRYIIPEKSKKTVKELKEMARKTDKIILATDEDREGEAIAWHLSKILDKDINEIDRIVFHEITKKAILDALKNPKKINKNLVDAQQARRSLDRLVGYTLSPFLWKKVAKGLSAGRVQSVAVRLIVEREKEIRNFTPQEYWTIESKLQKKHNKESSPFKAVLFKHNNQKLDKFAIKNEQQANTIIEDLKNKEFIVSDIKKKQINKKTPPPFTTSTLQQEASTKLGFSAKQTMLLAQQLYEGIELGNQGSIGLITYMRTDSVNLSNEAIIQTRNFIKQNFNKNYLPNEPKKYKTKSKKAQEAHEAIRPTFCDKIPKKIEKFLNKQQLKLYQLIWERMIASQMADAKLNQITTEIKAGNYIFKATGSTLQFDGFLKIYKSQIKESYLPILKINENLNIFETKPLQHFTEPPPRYSEATLIKALEEQGIGRPSTYAPIISTIQERNYVVKNNKKKLEPTEIAEIVNTVLTQHFSDIVNPNFTAEMENKLDQVAEGKTDWVSIVKNFYEPFSQKIEQKNKELTKKDITREEKTGEVCPKCGQPLIFKLGRYGKFKACSAFPKCKYTEPLKSDQQSHHSDQSPIKKCPKCGHDMVIKRGKYGKFIACSNFPHCKNIEPLNISTNIICPNCKKGEIIEKKTKKGKIFYSCSQYPECHFALWDKPIDQKCPKCKSLLIQKNNVRKCTNQNCKYTKNT